MGVWVFFIFVRICVFCVLLWWITLAVWWRETLTMTMERRDIYCHPFWSRDKGKKNHDILTTRQYFGRMFFFSQKIEIFGLHWHDMSAPFKRFKWVYLYRSQKMLWSSIRGCSSRALKTFELVQKLAKSAGDHSSTQTVGLWGGHNRL